MIRTREQHRTGFRWHSSVNPHAVIVPSPVARVLRQQARRQRTVRAVRDAVSVSIALATLVLLFVHTQAAMGLQAPPVPASEQICGSSVLNGGPSSPPGGAVTVPAGDDSGIDFTTPGTTYWFAAGTHTLGTGLYSQIDPGTGSVFTGAPGAVISGQGLNQFAFAGNNGGTTIEYLTIEDFIPPGAQSAINVNGEPDWTLEYSTVQDNLPGGGMAYGTNAVITGDCLTENGEYGFNGYTINDVSPVTGGPANVTMTDNEISYNDVCNWEADTSFPITPPAGCNGVGYSGCGCSGGGKFWENNDDVVADNYVHGNYATGLWADTNNAGFDFTGNYVAGNYAIGIEYEISYNAQIVNNIFVGNAIGVGPNNPGFPSSAVYLSESGADPRVDSTYNTTFLISGNQFYDNWGGVVMYENSNRYCTSPGNSSTGTCTLVNPEANLNTCSWNTPSPVSPSQPVRGPAPPPSRRSKGGAGSGQGQNFSLLINTEPYISDCRWKTQNVTVTDNLFDFDPGYIGSSCTTDNWCGFNGLFSEFGTIPPFHGTAVEYDVTFSQGNQFTGNTYCGPWQFDALSQGNVYTWAQWQGSPYDQDTGSTLDGASCYGPPPFTIWPGPVNRTVTIPIRTGGGSR